MQFDKPIQWNLEKNKLLKRKRGICFEGVVIAINEEDQIPVIPHPNQSRYPHQKKLVIVIRSSVYEVPFVEDDEKIFLKTIIPSRKAMKKFYKDMQ